MHSVWPFVVRSMSRSAHRVTLGARSPVFRAMFSQDMKEATEGNVLVEKFTEKVRVARQFGSSPERTTSSRTMLRVAIFGHNKT